jgi:hypothetical protein
VALIRENRGGVPDKQTLESAQANGPTPQGAEEVCPAIGLLETIAILARPQ